MLKLRNWLVKNGFTITRYFNCVHILEFSKANTTYLVRAVFENGKITSHYLHINFYDEAGAITNQEAYGVNTQQEIIDCINYPVSKIRTILK